MAHAQLTLEFGDVRIPLSQRRPHVLCLEALRNVLRTIGVPGGHVERGGGLTRVLSYQVLDAVRNGTLQVVLPKYEPPPLPIQLVHPSSRLLSANVKAFAELTLSTRDWNFTDV